MNNPKVMLIILCVALILHYVAQKQLLRKGWTAENPKPYLNRLMINGAGLILLSIFAFIAYSYPFGLFGILLFIEGAVCFAFARKLYKKPSPPKRKAPEDSEA